MRERKRSWLTAAELILAEADAPLHSKEIAAEAFRRGLMPQRGATPEYSVQAAIWRDVNQKRREKSPFIIFDERKNQRGYWLKRKMKKK